MTTPRRRASDSNGNGLSLRELVLETREAIRRLEEHLALQMADPAASPLGRELSRRLDELDVRTASANNRLAVIEKWVWRGTGVVLTAVFLLNVFSPYLTEIARAVLNLPYPTVP